MTTETSHLLQHIASQLPVNGYDNPRREAGYLLALALEREGAVFPHEDINLNDEENLRLNALIHRRQQGEPISRLRGWREFYSLQFMINHATLDPRADSEVLIDTTLAWYKDNPHSQKRILDLGTGSGCLLLAVLHNIPDASGLGVDIQSDAIRAAKMNAKALGLEERANFVVSNWDEEINGQDAEVEFEVILCNPPYIPTEEVTDLMAEVRLYDPLLALDGGEDGFESWRIIANIIRRRLTAKGTAIVEIGAGQESVIIDLFASHGLVLVEKIKDLSGILRCLRFELRL